MGPLGQEIRSTQVFPADTGRDSGPVGGSGTPLSQRRTLLFPGRPQEMKCVERDGMGWDGAAPPAEPGLRQPGPDRDQTVFRSRNPDTGLGFLRRSVIPP